MSFTNEACEASERYPAISRALRNGALFYVEADGSFPYVHAVTLVLRDSDIFFVVSQKVGVGSSGAWILSILRTARIDGIGFAALRIFVVARGRFPVALYWSLLRRRS